MPSSNRNEQRILVLAAVKNDSMLSQAILLEADLETAPCTDIHDLCRAISEGVGAIVVAEEMLWPQGFNELKGILNAEPPWSEIPVIIITSDSALTQDDPEIMRTLAMLSNVTLLERPRRFITLASIIRGALKSRQRQYEMRDLQKKYQQSSDAAEAASKAKSYFLANMSHEIRTPLGVIMGFSELLLDESTTDEDRVDFVSTIHRNGKILTQIIDDILDLCKVEADKLSIESIPCSIPELMADVEFQMRQEAQLKNIRLHLQTEDNVPRTIHTDPARLKQILINIIGNAIKFTKIGHVHVHLKRKELSKLEFIVEDTGRGISLANQRVLFQPFSQADITTTRKFGGTGLGLVLSRRLAEALGGTLELTASQENVGSTFTITLAV